MSQAEMEDRYEHVEYRFTSFMLHHCNTKQVHKIYSAYSVTRQCFYAKAYSFKILGQFS